MRTRTTREGAAYRGARYHDASPCAAGHDPCFRLVSCDECVDCRQGQRARRKIANAEHDREYQQRYRQDHPEHGEAKRQKYQGNASERLRYIVNAARRRARQGGYPFDLTVETLPPVPEHCPVLGIPLEFSARRTDSTPSLDKRIPSLGYVRGNIEWMSWRANRLKNDASPDELLRLAAHVNELDLDEEWW